MKHDVTRTQRSAAPRLATVVALITAGAAFCGPAAAQFGGGPADPFANLKNARKDADKAKKDPAVGRGDLRMSDTAQALRHLRVSLKLTDDQHARATTLLQDQQKRVTAIQSEKADAAEREALAEGVYRRTEEGIAAMLTEEQTLPFKLHYQSAPQGDTRALRMRKLATLHRQVEGKPTRDAASQWTDWLALTNAQTVSLVPLLEAEAKEIYLATKEAGGDEASADIRRRAALYRTERHIDSLLTPEQQKRLETMLLLPPPVTAPPAAPAATTPAATTPTN